MVTGAGEVGTAVTRVLAVAGTFTETPSCLG